ncbi:placenta-specific protein 8 -like [Brachionus plicatilis]|uniref:Placenta-specific protein 8-like n=1 Tax=Brachionus plicatilis TaxID=10195 RepID=A0A3M7RHQ8_BRAPC|nr:placenta-specific protein 8 -like [Brachionus plicatilis]
MSKVASVNNTPRFIQPKRMYTPLDFQEDWQYGLCECCSDCRICCLGFFCVPCMECIVMTDAREYIGTVPLAHSIANLRTKIRSTYKIKGSLDGDAATALFCRCCALVQLKKELMARGEILN